MLLFYVRHADPIYNPSSLTELGKRQAESVCRSLVRQNISKIFSSTSKRANDTAKPLCEMLHKEAEQLDWINEKYAWQEFTVIGEDGKKYWGYSTKKFAEMMSCKAVRDLGEEWYTYPEFPETFKSGIERVRNNTYDFLKGLGYEYDAEKNMYNAVKPNSENIALFAHEGIGGTFISTVLGIPYPLFVNRFQFTHSGVTAIYFSEDAGYCFPKVIKFSGDGHLYHDNIPAIMPGTNKYIR